MSTSNVGFFDMDMQELVKMNQAEVDAFCAEKARGLPDDEREEFGKIVKNMLEEYREELDQFEDRLGRIINSRRSNLSPEQSAKATVLLQKLTDAGLGLVGLEAKFDTALLREGAWESTHQISSSGDVTLENLELGGPESDPEHFTYEVTLTKETAYDFGGDDPPTEKIPQVFINLEPDQTMTLVPGYPSGDGSVMFRVEDAAGNICYIKIAGWELGKIFVNRMSEAELEHWPLGLLRRCYPSDGNTKNFVEMLTGKEGREADVAWMGQQLAEATAEASEEVAEDEGDTGPAERDPPPIPTASDTPPKRPVHLHRRERYKRIGD